MDPAIIITYPPVRLNSSEIEHITSLFKFFFKEGDHLWIFGSRVDLNKKGGDIDLCIETYISDAQKVNTTKLAFLTELYLAIGDQKIDLIVNRISQPFPLPIYEIAKAEGFQLA